MLLVVVTGGKQSPFGVSPYFDIKKNCNFYIFLLVHEKLASSVPVKWVESNAWSKKKREERKGQC